MMMVSVSNNYDVVHSCNYVTKRDKARTCRVGHRKVTKVGRNDSCSWTRRLLAGWIALPLRCSIVPYENHMDVLQARVDSFNKSKRLKQNSSKRTITVKWPHPSSFVATPHALAEAAFYHNPSPDDLDNVECFSCGKQLGGWEECDDPYRLHWDKCKNSCAWAVVRCGLIEDVDRKGK